MDESVRMQFVAELNTYLMEANALIAQLPTTPPSEEPSPEQALTRRLLEIVERISEPGQLQAEFVRKTREVVTEGSFVFDGAPPNELQTRWAPAAWIERWHAIQERFSWPKDSDPFDQFNTISFVHKHTDEDRRIDYSLKAGLNPEFRHRLPLNEPGIQLMTDLFGFEPGSTKVTELRTSELAALLALQNEFDALQSKLESRGVTEILRTLREDEAEYTRANVDAERKETLRQDLVQYANPFMEWLSRILLEAIDPAELSQAFVEFDIQREALLKRATDLGLSLTGSSEVVGP